MHQLCKTDLCFASPGLPGDSWLRPTAHFPRLPPPASARPQNTTKLHKTKRKLLLICHIAWTVRRSGRCVAAKQLQIFMGILMWRVCGPGSCSLTQ